MKYFSAAHNLSPNYMISVQLKRRSLFLVINSLGKGKLQFYTYYTDLKVGTCKIVKFSSTLFIMYFSGRCLSLWIKLIMYSHNGERWIRNT